MKNNRILLDLILDTLKPSTGCTEPAAIAYAAATCKEAIDGEITEVKILVDSFIFKNVYAASIPGFDRKGVEAAAALGFTVNTNEDKLNLLNEIDNNNVSQAKKLLDKKIITSEVINMCDGFFIQIILQTDEDSVRVTISESHDNIVEIKKGVSDEFDLTFAENLKRDDKILDFGLEDFKDFADTVDVDKLQIFIKGIQINLQAAKAGEKIFSQKNIDIDKALSNEKGDCAMSYVQKLCACASYARMSGEEVAVMTSTGSGNHGITLLLTLYGMAQVNNISEQVMLRALAFAQLINMHIKAHTGLLSAMCGCGIAAGIGASAGIVYMLGGKEKEVVGTIKNMIGSITGIICDGAKEGCAYKLALSSGWAIQSALLSMNGLIIDDDGIVVSEFEQLVDNLGYICKTGMFETNQLILETIKNK